MVRPEFFDSDNLARCCWGARLAFVGLLIYADDQGNLKLSLGRLRSHIFDDECTDDEFAVMLAQLEDVDCIRIYTDGDRAYINIKNFNSYQKISHPTESTIPKPQRDMATHVFAQLLDSGMAHGMNPGMAPEVTPGTVRPNKLIKELINKKASGGSADAPPASYEEIQEILKAKNGEQR